MNTHVDLQYLTTLLKLLKSEGVNQYQEGSLKLSFVTNIQATEGLHEVKVSEDSLPPDLRSDAINDMDKIMNWSASPAIEDRELPGTGEFEISGAV